MDTITKIRNDFLEGIEHISNSKELYDFQVKFLGKKGTLTNVMKELKDVSKEEKSALGKDLNVLKQEITQMIDVKKAEFTKIEMDLKLKSERIDVTQPGLFFESGVVHPLTKMMLKICNIFKSMGYDILSGPEVETDQNNFEMLNIPKNHSARDMQDTFYITDSFLLRTHTSPVQIAAMQANVEKGPIRIISPGKVFRRDEDDATHSHQFMQIEGLLIDQDISMVHLIGTLEELIKTIFGEERTLRVRPSYFPFTEPSIEVDIDCFVCKGAGCNICKKTGWIEVLGAGMVHPNVLKMSGYDSEKYSGFAFGIGIERFVMLKHEVKDIRDLYTNNIKFIKNMSITDGGGF